MNTPEILVPRLYCIVDAGCFAPGDRAAMTAFVRELIAGGATLIQYRDKRGEGREMLSTAREIRRVVEAVATADDPQVRGGAEPGAAVPQVRLVMNDRADLCLLAGFDGVHLGQDDLSPEGARRVVGKALWVGVSTHSPEQVGSADGMPVDYVAIGPVFATASKQNPDPVIGLEGVRRARELTRKPLVAIGGITRQNCRAVVDAGADSVAVISDLLREPRRAAADFAAILR